MNSSYLSNNGSFNVQYVINSSNSLHKEGIFILNKLKMYACKLVPIPQLPGPIQ